jgi:tetratricopeptide (TPR) repeat protein
MNWNEFIREVARQKLSSEKLRLTFIDTFGDNESPKIDKTVEGHLREIYKRFESECSALTTAKKGKKEILRDYLQTLYATQRDFTGSSDRPQPLTNPQNIPTLESIPELTTLEFIGRDRDLTNLANLSRQAKIVLIKAGAGVGKSTLAREFLQTQFKKVIRLEMGLESGNVTPAEEKVSQILRKDFDEEPSRDFGINLDILREKLADRANPIGVLIDNLEPALDENYRFREKLRGYDAFLAVLGDRDVCSFTLITSRRSLIATRAKVHEYSLEGLDITAWRQYFHDCENGADSEALMQMRDAYNGNAKVMDILHGAIKNRFDGNIEAYWNRYKDALLADSELETLISVEMDWLRDNQPDAYKLLCRMGCYRYQDVKTVPFEGVICLLWDVPESRRVCLVNYLSKTSLIEFKDEYYLHPAIKEFSELRLRLNHIEYELAHRSIAAFWTKSITSITTTEDALTAFEAYHHYVAIGQYELASDVIVKRRSNAWQGDESLGNSFYRLGFLESIKLVTINISSYLPQSPSLCKIYNILGDIYWLTGELHKAIDFHEKSKKLAVDFSIANYEFVSFLNIGLCYIDLWEIQLAIGNFKKCIELSIDTIHRDHAIDSFFCLSFLHSVLRENDKSLDFANKAFQEFNLTEHNTWSTNYRWLFLGKAYSNLFDFDKSIEMYKNALSFALKNYYPQVKANSFNGLSVISRIKNDFSQAINYHYKSISILENMGAKCDLAEAYFQLGLTYQAMGEHNQAKEYKAKALELFAQMEAPKQIERVNKAFGGNIQ